MKKILKKGLQPTLFTLGGALTGLGYYYLIGCIAGTCSITATLIRSMVYMALIGWLLSGVFKKGV